MLPFVAYHYHLAENLLSYADSEIWRPCGNTMINKFENFQKKCIKWILSELELSYSNEVYLRKCKKVNILPLLYRFMFNDINLFHKVEYKIIPVTMPDYLTTMGEPMTTNGDFWGLMGTKIHGDSRSNR